MDFSVAIAGAGLSGLCLAQYLTRAGIDVHVYERDPGPLSGGRVTGSFSTGTASRRCARACRARCTTWR